MTGLPDGWGSCTLAELLAEPLMNGRSVPDRPGGFPVLRLTSIRERHVDLSQHKQGAWSESEARPFLVHEGDMLVVRGNGSLDLVGRGGLVGPVGNPVAFPDTLIRVRPDAARIDRQFLTLAWDSDLVRRQLEGRARTTAGIYKVNQTHLREVTIPLPGLPEQRRIVEILENHLSHLDAANQSLHRQATRLGTLRQSVLSAQYRMLVDAGAPTRAIAEIAATSLGKMLDAKRASGLPTPYLRNINVRWGSVDLADVKQVLLDPDERERFALTAGDVLICEGGEPGRCAVWAGSDRLMTFQKALHRVRVHRTVADPYFVALMVEQAVRSGRTDRFVTGTTIKHLPQASLRLIGLPLPSLPTQRAVVAEVSELADDATSLDGQLQVASRRAASLRRALLAAAFSGRLTGRSSDLDLAEEMAPA